MGTDGQIKLQFRGQAIYPAGLAEGQAGLITATNGRQLRFLRFLVYVCRPTPLPHRRIRAQVADAADWRWSSAKSHLSGCDDELVRVAPLLAMVADWRGLLNSAIPEEEFRDLRMYGRTGCPLGDAIFVERLEQAVGRILRPQQPGRPSKLLKRP